MEYCWCNQSYVRWLDGWCLDDDGAPEEGIDNNDVPEKNR